MWAVWIAAEGAPSLFIVWIFALGTLLMRSAGVVMNDYADRHFDPHVERTKNRPLAAGIVSEREALLLAAGVTLCAFLLILPLHKLVWALSVVALFLAATYPLTKRFLAIPQAYLGHRLRLRHPDGLRRAAVPGAAAGLDADAGEHLLGHRLRHLLRHGGPRGRPEDRHQDLGHHLRPLRRGGGDGQLCGDAGDPGLGRRPGGARPFFYAGLAVAGGMMLRHYFWIRGRERMACFRAFLDNNWVGAAIFAGLASLDYALRSGRWPAV
jgi:4-hydroxybenzoate polyprenyltransferase